MPLTTDDAVTITAKAVALSKVIAESLSADGESGKRVSKKELGLIVKATLELLAQLVIDIID